MTSVPKQLLALGLAALAGPGLKAGGRCSSLDKVERLPKAKEAPAPKPGGAAKPTGEDTPASFEVSEVQADLVVSPDRQGWDGWEGTHGFLVVNASKADWHLVPDAKNAPMRVVAEDGPGLDGGVIVPAGKAVRFAFQSGYGPQWHRALFSIQDGGGTQGARIVFTAKPPARGVPGLQELALVDLVGQDYKDFEILEGHPKQGLVGIRANKYL